MKKLISLGAALFCIHQTAMAVEPHRCATLDDLGQVEKCFAGLEEQERITGFRDSIDYLATRLSLENPAIGFSIAAPSEEAFTESDAVAVYREIYRIFEAAYREAQAQNKQLIFIGGESHVSRNALMYGTMLIKVARRFGAQRFGFETARETFIATDADSGEKVHYRGLLDILATNYDSLDRLPTDEEAIPENFLGGTRHNQVFETWSILKDTELLPREKICFTSNCWHTTEGLIGRDTYVFAGDPMFWNWSKYPDIFGYTASREPGMAITLVEQSIRAKRGTPVVGIYGYMHFMGIQENLTRTYRDDRVLFRTLGFVQSLDVYYPGFRDDMEHINGEMKWLIDHNVLQAGANMVMRKKGPETAAEALRLADYADRFDRENPAKP